MPYNGAGVFQPVIPPDYPAVSGSVIRAQQFNTVISDLIGGLSTALTRDGQSRPTADINWGGRKITNMAEGVADSDAATVKQAKAGAASGTIDLTATYPSDTLGYHVSRLANTWQMKRFGSTNKWHVGLNAVAVDNSVFVNQSYESIEGGLGSLWQIQRYFDADQTPWSGNRNTLRVYTRIGDDSGGNVRTGIAWGISSEMEVWNTGRVTGDSTAISGVVYKKGSVTNGIAGHFQVRDDQIISGSTEPTPSVGVEINCPSIGSAGTGNNGFGNRYLMTLYARTNFQKVGTPGFTTGEQVGILLQHTTNGAIPNGAGYFRYGIVIRDMYNYTGVNPLKEAGLRVDVSGKFAIQTFSNPTVAHVDLNSTLGTTPVALRISGTYTNAAISIPAGQAIGLESTGSILMRYRLVGGNSPRIEFLKDGVVTNWINLAQTDNELT